MKACNTKFLECRRKIILRRTLIDRPQALANIRLLNPTYGDNMLAHPSLERIMDIHTGEIYGKQTASKFVMYNVLKVSKAGVILQNIDNPLSLFETTAQKLAASGYVRISQTPYVNMESANTAKRRKAVRKPVRCPYTFDFLEDRADSQRPAPIAPGLFA